ncbi:MAG: sulfotransferase domain-containing protein [Bacteroidota bacterium]
MSKTKKNIIWIASYPKSGNTWFRVFLSNVLSQNTEPISINDIINTPIASSRELFDYYSGVSSSDLTLDEINRLRPRVYQQLSDSSTKSIFIKVHDAWGFNKDELPIFPPEITKGVIYIVRNPFDICISASYHNSISIEQSVKNINNSNYKLGHNEFKLNKQITHVIQNWSEHIVSWLDTSNLPVHVLKYEDLLDDPLKHFSQSLEFLQIDCEKNKIEIAIKNSSFKILQDMEYENGFKERPIYAKMFFRAGKTNIGRDMLEQRQITQLTDNHKKMMQRFNYLCD